MMFFTGNLPTPWWPLRMETYPSFISIKLYDEHEAAA